MPDAEQRDQEAVAPRLGQHAFPRVDQDHAQVRGRRARDHVARVLLVTGAVRDDELALLGGEESVGHVDRDPLLALGRQAVEQQREVELPGPRAHPLRVGLQRRELIVEQRLGLEQQAADERALAVVDAAAGVEPEQALVHVRADGGVDGGQIRSGVRPRAADIRSSPPAS